VVPGPYAEGLNASFGTPSGNVTGSGSVTNLAGTDNLSMVVTLDTSSAGARSGLIGINLASNGTNSGLADTALDPQAVSMSALVYDRGVASFVDSPTKVDTLSLLLSGSLGATVTESYDIYNLLQTVGYTGALDVVSFPGTGNTGQLHSGLSTCKIDADSSQSFTASLDTSVIGSYSATYTLDLQDAASDGIDGGVMHQTLYLHIDGQVVPEPSTGILLAAGLIGLLAFAWRKRRYSESIA